MGGSSKLIKEAEKTYKSLGLDNLPKELQRNSLYYYYLSVYPSLLQMTEIDPKEVLKYPDLITSAYLHIPFCSGVCSFCSYFLTTVEKSNVSPVEDYLSLVEKELKTHRKKTDIELSYLYVGGGTPSLIPFFVLEKFLTNLRAEGLIAEKIYGTLELHPEFFEDMENARNFIQVLKHFGITRVSVGYQSSDKKLLDSTNRRHDTQFIEDAIVFLKEEGMLVNLDLMYGLPQLSHQDWETTLNDAITLNPDSISTYFLFVTPGTVMREDVKKGHITLPSHKKIQVQHIMAQVVLEKAGYLELPNDFYAKVAGDPSEFRQHALPADSKSLPIGAGSYGYFNNVQFFNQFSLKRYKDVVLANNSPAWREVELDSKASFHRDVMFSFKNSPSLERQLFFDRYNVDLVSFFKKIFEYLVEANLVEISKERVCLTPKGRLLVEEIAMLFRDPRISNTDISNLSKQMQKKLAKHNFAPTYPASSLSRRDET